jgi:hypothetical protein
MNNDTIRLKIKQRLNKLDSQDYDNIECWQMVEAFNKAQVVWCRRQLHGTNSSQEGDESSKRRIDDLQVILTETPVNLKRKDIYYLSEDLPENYFAGKRVDVKASTDTCPKSKPMVVYLVEEANISLILRDNQKNPNFEWGETIYTLADNKLKIYTNNLFAIDAAKLVYYRQPTRVQFLGCANPYSGQVSTIDVPCDFKDDIIELMIDEAVKILAGDLESFNQQQVASSQVETNN